MKGIEIKGIEKLLAIMVVSFCTMVAMMIIFTETNGDAMTVCQLSHSYDMCFQALNR